jgi:hypothetical protein
MSSSSPQPPPRQSFAINVPPEEEAGHYADFASIWHNSETFVLDFAALTRPPQSGSDETGGPTVEVHAKVVSRVRIPASQVWEVMKALEQHLTAWEGERKLAGGGQPPDRGAEA